MVTVVWCGEVRCGVVWCVQALGAEPVPADTGTPPATGASGAECFPVVDMAFQLYRSPAVQAALTSIFGQVPR
jgi:hypothetical protein